MPITDLLGRHATLPVRRLATPGAFLALDPGNAREDAPALLLPRAEVPANTQLGDELAVFVHLDSEDRPIATTRTPAVALGEVAFLPVRNLTSFGAFVDWGLPKDLLVPFAEQTCDLRVGDRHAIGLYIDATRRLGGTMRVNPLLREPGEFEVDARVDGEIWRIERGIGTFVILQRRFVGLVQDAVLHETGVLPKLSTSGGTSDARFVKDYCPVLEFGPTNATIHQTDERIAIDELRATQNIYGRIIADYFSTEL